MQLIVNADDFGRSSAINRAVVRAYREGVLGSASLMVAGEAAEEAVALARQNPGLSVGLHLVVVDGAPVLPPERLRRLVDERGRLPDAPVRLGLKYAFSRGARLELAAEVAAQFDRFAATGLPLAHVDGHQHMHMHPVVFDIMLPLAEKYRAGRVRIVRDDLRLALSYSRRGAVGKVLTGLAFYLLERRCRRRLRSFALAAAERTYGLYQSGAMDEAYVIRVIEQMHESLAEIYFHPAEGERLDRLGPNPTDLETLLSAAVASAIRARGLALNHHLHAASPGCADAISISAQQSPRAVRISPSPRQV